MGKNPNRRAGGKSGSSSDGSSSVDNSSSSTTSGGNTNSRGSRKDLTVKRTRKISPRESPLQRSSVHRGVTRHRWTGRYEAHLWDKDCWNESQKKKGRQVYLGAYDDEEAAAHAYDLAALKYWGRDAVLNFPLSTYEEDLKEMEGLSREEYIGSLRRKSSGFSRGVSRYRGVARHHHNGRWEARIGRVFGNKYLYLGTYATQEEAAAAYDMAAIQYRGLNAVTNFDISRYVQWHQPPNSGNPNPNFSSSPDSITAPNPSPGDARNIDGLNFHRSQGSAGEASPGGQRAGGGADSPSAPGFLLQSREFMQAMGRSSSTPDAPPTPPESDFRPPPRCSFPEDVQTYFGCQEGGGFTDGDDVIFGDLDSFVSTVFQWEQEY